MVHGNFLAGKSRGKGVIYLTGHIGAWELSSYAHALYGFPVCTIWHGLWIYAPLGRFCDMNIAGESWQQADLQERSGADDAESVEAGGNDRDSLRTRTRCRVKACSWIFFGKQACTTTGIARVALHTDAAVVPGIRVLDQNLRKYRLRFEGLRLELVRTGDAERDVQGKHSAVYEGDRGDYPEASGAMGLDSCAVEEPAGGGTAAV